MGKIVRQGVEYGGSSNSADCIKYNDTKSVKEAIDEIKASSSSNSTAASVTFDNTDTGLEATNVQDAVTEVNGKLQWEKYVTPTVLKDMPTSTFKAETFNELIGAKEFLIVVGNSYVAYIDNSIGLSSVSANVNFPYGENYGYRFAVIINSEGLVQVYTELVGTLVKTLTINRIYYR